MLRILNQTSLKSPFPTLASVGKKKIESFLYQQNGINYFNSLVYQATPGFELGKKDLQSPALPLGHAAKMIQIYENTPSLKKPNKQREGVLNFFFWCVCILNSVFFNPPFQRDLLPFSIVLLKKKNKRIAFSHKSKNFGTNQIATFNYKFLNNSWIWISNGFFLMRKKIEIDTLSISIITATVNICQPQNINFYCYTDII